VTTEYNVELTVHIGTVCNDTSTWQFCLNSEVIKGSKHEQRRRPDFGQSIHDEMAAGGVLVLFLYADPSIDLAVCRCAAQQSLISDASSPGRV